MNKKYLSNSHRLVESFRVIVFILLFLNCYVGTGYSQWLQWGGPNRNFKVDSAQLKKGQNSYGNVKLGKDIQQFVLIKILYTLCSVVEMRML